MGKRAASGLAFALAVLFGVASGLAGTGVALSSEPSRDSASAGPMQIIVRVSPSEGGAPLAVDLAAHVSGGSAPYTYAWDFGDGSNDETGGRRQEHTYTDAGRFRVVVSVTDSLGRVGSARAVIGVTSENDPLSGSCSSSAASGENIYTIQFSADAEGGVGNYEYFWDFGDGSTSTRRNPKHTYERRSAAYVVRLDITSGVESQTCQMSLVFGGFGMGPDVECSSSGNGGAAPYSVNLSAVATGGTKPYTFLWDPGDNSGTIEGRSVRHTYEKPGTFLAIVTATDAGGLADICGRQVVVTEIPYRGLAATE